MKDSPLQKTFFILGTKLQIFILSMSFTLSRSASQQMLLKGGGTPENFENKISSYELEVITRTYTFSGRFWVHAPIDAHVKPWSKKGPNTPKP